MEFWNPSSFQPKSSARMNTMCGGVSTARRPCAAPQRRRAAVTAMTADRIPLQNGQEICLELKPVYGSWCPQGGPAPRNLVTVDNTSHLQRNSLFKYTCIRYRSTGNRAHKKNTQSRHSEPYNLQSTSWDADRDGQSTRDGDRGERATTCRVEVAARRQHASGPEATAPRLPERKHAVG